MKPANEFNARHRPTPLFETEVAPVSVRISLLAGLRLNPASTSAQLKAQEQILKRLDDGS